MAILQGQTKTIAVLDFDGDGVSQSETRTLTNRLRDEMFKTGVYIVLERGKMDEVLKEQGFQQVGCITSECAVQVGRMLGVQQMVAGSIGKVGTVYTVSARIFDVETGKILKSANYDHIGDIGQLLLIGMKDVAKQLTIGSKAKKVFIEGGTLKGHVKFDGKPPKKKTLRMDADPVCGSSHSGPVYSENFKMTDDGSMEEALVYLRNVSYSGGAPKDPVVLDQKGCIYKPHILGMVAGQELLIKNSDATLHNIHSMPNVNKEFNFAMPKVVKEKTTSFSKSEEDPFYIKCDVHPWMKSWMLVSDHPYFAVTDAEGNFSIEGIPAGTYEVVCWQEKFKKKPLTASVKIGDGETVQDFTFTRPKKGQKKIIIK